MLRNQKKPPPKKIIYTKKTSMKCKQYRKSKKTSHKKPSIKPKKNHDSEQYSANHNTNNKTITEHSKAMQISIIISPVIT